MLTSAGISVWAALSRNTSAMPSSNAPPYSTAKNIPWAAGGEAVPAAMAAGGESWPEPSSTTTATPRVTVPRARSIHPTRRRRSTRSVITPAGRVKSSQGRRVATATRAMCTGLRVTAEASHG